MDLKKLILLKELNNAALQSLLKALHYIDYTERYCRERNMPTLDDSELVCSVKGILSLIQEINSGIDTFSELGMTESEINDWLKNELDFSKQIVKPLDHRKRDTRNGHHPDETV